MKKYFCSVYNKPEKRFNSTNNADGCWESTRLNLKKDYFPGSPNIMFWINGVLETMFWAPKKCDDGTMRPLGIKECTFIWNNKIEEYEGECTQCGQCCGLYLHKIFKYLGAYETTT